MKGPKSLPSSDLDGIELTAKAFCRMKTFVGSTFCNLLLLNIAGMFDAI